MRILLVLIIFLNFSNLGFSQTFEFVWRLDYPESSSAPNPDSAFYSFTMIKDIDKCKIKLEEKSSNFSSKKNINCDEVEPLLELLKTYDFRKKNDFKRSVTYEYLNTEFIKNDSVLINGEGYLKARVPDILPYLLFDSLKNAYYMEDEISINKICCRNPRYYGTFSFKNEIKEFQYYPVSENKSDSSLTVIIESLILENFKKTRKMKYFEYK